MSTPVEPSQDALRLYASHQRDFQTNRFVYPVLSRRSGGISVGVNLNPDKVCNFDCIYCQVDRVSRSETTFVDTDALIAELEGVLQLVTSGELFSTGKFAETPEPLRRLNDIAFSGDGEPTTYRNFDEIIAACAAVKVRSAPAATKMVLITNATMLHRPHVERGLCILDANEGEIWAKLEAGSEPFYRQIERTTIPFARVLANITGAARRRPVVIQSLFMRIDGQSPPAAELEAFCDRLNDIIARGGMIRHVQIYTVARPPAESNVTALADGEVDAIAQLVRSRTGLSTSTYYGSTT